MIDSTGLTFEDSVGSHLLTAVLEPKTVIKERHDAFEIPNHVYLRQNVRLVVSLERFFSPGARSSDFSDPAGHMIPGAALQTWYGRTVVPLTSLDRHSRATTHVVNEEGDLVPLFTSNDLDRLLGGGLVAFATRVLGKPVPTDLARHLRQLPSQASRELAPARKDSRAAADAALDSAKRELLTFSDGLALVQSWQFSHALSVITGSEQLVVALDNVKGPVRILSFGFDVLFLRDPLAGDSDGNALMRVARKASRSWKTAGTKKLRVSLASIGDCDRYHITAEAPFDTWFASAHLATTSGTPEPVDTSYVYRLTHSKSTGAKFAGTLNFELRSVYTGVARTSVYASAFLAACCVTGTLRVAASPAHTFLDSNTDAGASVLLLFPGIAASLLATPARNTLTATMQFPLRFTLWCLCLASFVLASATAVGLSGWPNLVLWCVVSLASCLAAVGLSHRGKTIRTTDHVESGEDDDGHA